MPPANGSDPLAVLEQMQEALNRHDLDAFAGCFAADYQSQQPAHPERPFTGSAQVRKNWSQIFDNIRDFRADLLGQVAAGHDFWAEWRWSGAHADGAPFEMRGVTIMTIRDGLVRAARLYMEPVQQAAGNIDTTVKELTTAPGQRA